MKPCAALLFCLGEEKTKMVLPSSHRYTGCKALSAPDWLGQAMSGENVVKRHVLDVKDYRSQGCCSQFCSKGRQKATRKYCAAGNIALPACSYSLHFYAKLQSGITSGPKVPGAFLWF